MKKRNLFGIAGIVLALSFGFAGCESSLNSADVYSDGNAALSARSVRVGAAVVSNVTVSGQTGAAISPVTLTITLDTDHFWAIGEGDDLSDWFTNLPNGLVAEATADVDEDAQAATITISGTPTVTSTQVMAITIPADYLEAGPTDITVATNTAAKYNIAQTIGNTQDFATWANAVNAGDTAQSAVLTGDIDFGGIAASYLPIGLLADGTVLPYTGTFDGNCYAVQNINVVTKAGFAGLFAANKGSIRNLTVTGTVQRAVSREQRTEVLV